MVPRRRRSRRKGACQEAVGIKPLQAETHIIAKGMLQILQHPLFLTGRIIILKRYTKKGLKPREVWRGRSPSMINPQQRHARCEDEFLRSGACGARAKILSLRICRPGGPKVREANPRGYPIGGRVPLSPRGCETAPPQAFLPRAKAFRFSSRNFGGTRAVRASCQTASSRSK